MKITFRFTLRRLLVFLFLCAITFVAPLFLYWQGYRIGLSESLPYHVFRVYPYLPTDPLSVHDLVVVNVKDIPSPMIQAAIERRYLPSPYLVKEIGAASGDVVEIVSHDLFINGEKTDLFVAFQDSQGNPLSPAISSPVVLDADSFWLLSAPRGGFDSRYFGPVKRSSIKYRAVPIF